MEDLLDVGKYIYEKVPFASDKKIQKLTYYAYCWYIVKYNNANNITKRLVNEHPEAWIHGPVFYDLFNEMTHYRERFKERKITLHTSTQKFLDLIISIYGRFTANQLEDMTHNESPWICARNGIAPDEKSRNLLSDEEIYAYYSN